MTDKACVVVLEDSIGRVKWLQSEFPNVNCVHAESVNSFIEVLKAQQHVELIILDHDLGETLKETTMNVHIVLGSLWPMDKDGNNGSNAVELLDAWKDIPVIVWSINTVAAPKMVETLKEKGFVATWIPFRGELKWRLRAAIASQVG